MEHRSIEAELTAAHKTFALSAVTGYPALQIQYCGEGAVATIEVEAAGDIIVTVDAVVYATFDVSTIATYALLEAAIMGYADLRCFLIGVLPSQACNNKTITMAAATSIMTDHGITLFCDAAVAALDQGFAVSNQKFENRQTGGFSTKLKGWTKDTVCKNSVKYMSAQLTAVGNANCEFWAIDADGNEVLLYDRALVTTVEDEFGESGAGPEAVFIEAPMGFKLLVYFDCAAANTAVAINANCKTTNMTGGVATSGNYTGMS